MGKSRTQRSDVEKGMGTTTSSRAFELESWAYVQHKDYYVQFMKKVQRVSTNRPPIETTESERLAYLRGFSCTPFKLQKSYLQQNNFSNFFWLYITNLLLRSLPMNYLHTFLAEYNPDEHFFSAKMVPLFTGVKWQILLCSYIQLVAYADFISYVAYYAIKGFYTTLQYNSCPHSYPNKNPIDPSVEYMCYSCDDFINITKGIPFEYNDLNYSKHNVSLNYYGNYYIWSYMTPNKTLLRGGFFQAAPQVFFLHRFEASDERQLWTAVYLALWFFGAVFYKQIFKKYVWKVMYYSQAFLSAVYLVTALYITWYFLESNSVEYTRVPMTQLETISLEWDFDYLGEAFSAPPVLHFLVARSGDQVNPSRDSFVITASNSIYYFFNSLCNYKMKSYVESFLQLPLWFSHTNAFPIFTCWPWLFHRLSYGSLAARVFYGTSLLVEFWIFMITYHITVELLFCEWKKIPRWVFTIAIYILGVICGIFLSPEEKFLMYAVTTSITAVTEVVIVCWVYPLERLTDDINFHHGRPAGSIRIWSLRFLPIYHIYKLYYLFCGVGNFQKLYDANRDFQISVIFDHSSISWVWIVGVTPLLLGAFYALVKCVIFDKQRWFVLIRPRPEWGPREHVTRQLRKQYDSREYIASQASRYLSRHLLAKAETPTYRLDIKYGDDQQRKNTFSEGAGGAGAGSNVERRKSVVTF